MYESWIADHIDAQNNGFRHGVPYERAISELESGRKQTHWVWYVFPQWVGLGTSREVQRFGVPSIRAATEYLGHPTLRANFFRAISATRSHLERGIALARILGSLDSKKFVSSLTLMEQAINQSDASDNLSAQMREILQIAQEQGFDRCQRTIAWLENE